MQYLYPGSPTCTKGYEDDLVAFLGPSKSSANHHSSPCLGTALLHMSEHLSSAVQPWGELFDFGTLRNAKWPEEPASDDSGRDCSRAESP